MLESVVRTLFIAGYTFLKIERSPNYALIFTSKNDEFSLIHKHLFAVAEDLYLFDHADHVSLSQVASADLVSLVFIGEFSDDVEVKHPVLSREQLYSQLGGPVSSFLPLEPDYGTNLLTLSLNKLPSTILEGTADDNFEEYVFQGLQFIFNRRVVRYGKKRSGKELPDGVIPGDLILIYDCKAAKDGYKITAESMRQFSKYVEDFRKRYGSLGFMPHGFLVISSSFESTSSLNNRSKNLYSSCNVLLSTFTATALSKTVELLLENSVWRNSMDWRKIFSSTVVSFSDIEKNLLERKKDRIISR